MHQCSSYQGITTGSYRSQLKEREGVLRPDLNIFFDQVTYDSKRDRMLYFTGGRTLSYAVRERRWSDASPDSQARRRLAQDLSATIRSTMRSFWRPERMWPSQGRMASHRLYRNLDLRWSKLALALAEYRKRASPLDVHTSRL